MNKIFTLLALFAPCVCVSAYTPESTLAIKSVTLEASKRGDMVYLHWFTEGEMPGCVHRLKRGISSTDLSTIATVSPAGVLDSNSYPDHSPLPGTNYYRVEVDGIDGTHVSSPMAIIRMDQENLISVFPNPANTSLHINGIESGRQVRLHDMTGRAVWAGASAPFLVIRTEGLAAGVYLLVMERSSGPSVVHKIEIAH